MEEKETKTRQIADKEYKAALSKRFGARVQELMDKKGLNQAELGRRAGMSRSVINNLLRGIRNPSLLTALTVSRALGVSLDELTAGNVVDMVDTQDAVNSTFKIDFLDQLGKLLSSSDYYSNQLKPLTQADKDTILRLVYAYLNVNKARNYKGDDE
ncbi:helix-turn-helix domain-containing protein [Limosilactobacillus reuteri]|uniref:helix-turn-helix domain-containing protein n=1 Tax=Limosilactobacillus reuteri TaxID=1598 RepID=UPI0021BA733A|nr:helix-turn-helix transcriptional regulator [Limosilactobacillus reuteri]UXE90183.1 helix-turn-helix transcriptional regulator [Limosilactobacillus reuteri]